MSSAGYLSDGHRSQAICDRCRATFKWQQLMPDPNALGLRVCKDCIDIYNPYRLPPISPDAIALPWTRPYVNLVAPPKDWYAYTARPQIIPGVTATQGLTPPPPPPIEERVAEPVPDEYQESDYTPNRLKARHQNLPTGERGFTKKG